MEVGDKVRSKLYSEKGIGTILGFNKLFGTKYAIVLFQDKKITTDTDDLVLINDPVYALQKGNTATPARFWTKNSLIRIRENISENKIATSANYKIKPLPHQLLAVDFVMNRFQPRSLIADEVGLGKTIEAILIYEEYKLRDIVNKAIIIVPSGLVLQWHEELANKFNENFVIYNKDYIRNLKQSYGEQTNVWKLHDKIIVSIDSVKPLKVTDDLSKEEKERREWHNKHIFEDLSKAGFDIAIFDEAHKLSKYGTGEETARFKLGEKLSQSIPILLLLTATPHQGKEHLFLNLLRLIDPVLFATKESLKPDIVNEVTVRNKKRAAVDFDNNRLFKHRITSIIEIERTEAENEDEIKLYELVTKYTSRYYNYAQKTNNQILILLVMLYQRIVSSSSFALLETMKRRKEFLLNSTVQRDEDFEDEDIDVILYNTTYSDKRYAEEEKEFLDRCIELAQRLTATYKDAKFRKLIDVIDEIKKRENDPTTKVIIFTKFRATQNAIIEFLGKYGYKCSFINGSLSREERMSQVEDFKQDHQIMVSTDAGGEGLNLQFCHCVINFDLPWNPSRLEQRIGRIDRIGQKHNCLVFNFHLTDTIEDRVRNVLEAKLKNIKEQFGEDKYTDILSVLEDEFSFDKIYLDAVKKKNKQKKKLDKVSDKMYKKAKQILEKDELLVPFSKFDKDPTKLVNTELNYLIKNLVFKYLYSNNIEINQYKEHKDFYYFTNPFQESPEEPNKYRNVTFFNKSLEKMDTAELVNLDHKLVKNISSKLDNDLSIGRVSAIEADINKFQSIKGFWFVFKLFISNNVNKTSTNVINVFMEDKDFHNTRISRYLNKNILKNTKYIQNFQTDKDIYQVYNTAYQEAEKQANDIFTAKKITWYEEIERDEKKFKDYWQFKENSFSKIKIDNIRESKLNNLEQEKSQKREQFKLQKNIVPELELYQVAYVEFI